MGKKLHQENKQLQSAFPKQGKEVQKFLLKVQNPLEVEVRQQVKVEVKQRAREVKKPLQSQKGPSRLQHAKEQVKNSLLVNKQLNLQQAVSLHQEDQKPRRNRQQKAEAKLPKNRQQGVEGKPQKNPLQGKGAKQDEKVKVMTTAFTLY